EAAVEPAVEVDEELPQAVSAAAAAAAPHTARNERRLIFFMEKSLLQSAFCMVAKTFSTVPILYENVFVFNSLFKQNLTPYFGHLVRLFYSSTQIWPCT